MIKLLKNNLAARMAAIILAGLAAAAIPTLASRAANISLLTGPNDPSQGQVTINSLIQSINTGVSGLLNSQYTSSATGAGTSEQTLYTYTLPPNTLKTAGQTLHIKCYGVTAANGNNKTMKLYFGTTSVASPTAATNNKGWFMNLDVTRGASGAVQITQGAGQVDTTAVTPAVAAGTDDMTTALTIKCTGTDGSDSAGDIVGKAMTVEISQ